MSAMLALAYSFGFRKGELLDMKVGQVDLLARSIRLNPGETKNGEGRTVNLTDPSHIKLLAACITGKRAEDAVFTRKGGKPVKDFRGTWRKLCCSAGLGQMICKQCSQPVEQGTKCKNCPGRKRLKYRGLIFHDQRRSAVRNMRKAEFWNQY